MNRNKFISLLLICLISINMFPNINILSSHYVEAADKLVLNWDESHSLNKKLQITNVETQYHDKEILSYWDVERNGTYILSYNLENNRKIEAEFLKSKDSLNVKYRVYDVSATSTSVITVDAAKDYAEVDYTKTPIDFELEVLEPIIKDDAVVFENVKKNEIYSGRSFFINGKNVRFYWKDDRIYYFTDGIQEGCITPFQIEYRPASGEYEKYKLNILSKLEDFTAKPTHYISTTEQAKTIEIPESSEKPGGKPGIDLTFKHPKIWNESTKKFEYDEGTINTITASFVLNEYSHQDNATTQFEIKLDRNSEGNIVGKLVTDDIANNNAKYTYDSINHTYTVRLVKDKSMLSDKFAQWSKLEPSRIYETEVYFTPKTEVINADPVNMNEYGTYIPEERFAYTYLDYRLKRESIQDAYLEVIPYAGIKDDILKYDVYVSRQNTDYLEKEKWLTYTHEIGDEIDKEPLYIPVIFDDVGYYYKINIRFDGQTKSNNFESQVVKYRSNPDEVVPPPVPKILQIKNKAVVPPDKGDLNTPSKIMFDLEWQAPKKELINQMLDRGGSLYYELLINEEPEAVDKYKVVKVFEVKKEGEDIKVNECADVSSSGAIGIDEQWNDFKLGYNEVEDKFGVKGVVFKDETQWVKQIDVSDNEQIKTGQYNINKTSTDYEGIKNLPNINFLRMRAVYIVPSKNKGEYSNISIAKSLSLNMLTYDVPIVDGLGYKDIVPSDDNSPISFNLSWNIVDTTDYEKFMLKPVNATYKALKYEVYLSQDKDKLLNINVDDYKKYLLDNIVTNATGDEADIVDFENHPEYLKKLRDNQLVIFEINGNKDMTIGKKLIVIKGTDPNQVYYARIVTRIDYKQSDGVDKQKHSSPSEILSITTGYNSGKPIDNDKIPLIPENFEVLEHISTSTIKLGWDINTNPIEDDETIGYEVIRTADKQLPDKYGKLLSIEDIVKNETDVEGFRIINEDGNGYKYKKYDKENDRWDIIEGKHEVKKGKVKIIDDTLKPNTVYYYYLRAVRVFTKESSHVNDNIPASLWTAITYTAEPLESPINLNVDYSSDYSYDAKKEFIIYFDTPVPKESSINYIPEIYLFSQDDRSYNKGYKLADCEQLAKKPDGAPEGYVRYYYRIKGLKPGKAYSIKVRVGVEGQQTTKSAFSERITARTDFDEAEYDRENKLNNYLSYYDNKTEELYKTLYWVNEDDDKAYSIKYRKQHFIGELNSMPNNEFVLESKDKKQLIYYIPKEVIDTINSKKIKLTIIHNDMKISVNPDTIDKSIDEVNSFIQKVEDLDELKDYYFKLSVNFTDYNNRVNGTEPITDLAKIRLDVVGSKEYDLQIDNMIRNKLDDIIKSKRIVLEKELISEINKPIIDENRLLKVVDEKVAEVCDSHSFYIHNLLENNTNTSYSRIYKVNEPITLSLKTKQNSNIQLYQRNGVLWDALSTSGNDYTAEADIKVLGEYIYAGQDNLKMLDDSIDNSKEINNIITKYKLTDFYSQIDLSDLQASDRKYNVIYSTARIMGAPNDVDAVNWLKQKGITDINNRNIYNPIQKQDALYILTKTYEYKAGINLNAVVIKNYNAIKDKEKIKPKYQRIILQAVSLELIKLDDGYFKPTNPITIEETLNIFNKIENREW